MAVVLWQSLGYSYDAAQKQKAVSDTALIGAINGFARTALLTEEYGDMAPYFQEILHDPHVTHIMLVDVTGRVVSSTDPAEVGQFNPEQPRAENRYWRVSSITNVAGEIGRLYIAFSNKQLDEAFMKSRQRGIQVALLGMVVIAVIGVVVGILLTRRLNRLAQSAEELALGNQSIRSLVRGEDEIGVLGKNFDRMADAIERNTRELKAHVRDRTFALEQARDEAVRANQAKSDFLSNMSHELRTPLNSIIGFTNIVKDEMVGTLNSEQKKQLSLVDVSARHLLELINNILDLSKIEAGKMEVALEHFDIEDLIEEAIDHIKVLFLQKGLTIESSLEPCRIEIKNDRKKIYQILLNLLSNSLKFTDRGGVRVKCRVEEQNVEISVIDTGIGIDPKKTDLIFHSFQQSNVGDRRTHQGTGLGLSIAQKFAKMLNGEIFVKSSPGQGSQFILYLPECVCTAEEMKAENELPS